MNPADICSCGNRRSLHGPGMIDHEFVLRPDIFKLKPLDMSDAKKYESPLSYLIKPMITDLNEHIEEMAGAFLKRTNLHPDQVEMKVEQGWEGNIFVQKIWFEPKKNNIIDTRLKVWINTTFTGYYPVGAAAVVIAESSERAAELLNIALIEKHLKGDVEAKDMFSISLAGEFCSILLDGNY